MTRKRNDSHSTEFGLWLREQEELDSKTGFVATNLDFIFYDYKRHIFMLLEEKRFMSEVSWSQYQVMKELHDAIVKSGSDRYCGMFLLQFSQTSPDDSDRVLLNRTFEMDKARLTRFLSMKWFNPGDASYCFGKPPPKR